MKVLMINMFCGIRSTGRICTDIARALESEGHEVKIAYARGYVPEEYQSNAIRIGSSANVYLHALKARIFDAMGYGSKNATEKFIDWVKTYNPDIIHLHNIHGYYINIDVLFDYLHTCGKRIIWTLHDCWAFTGHSAYCDAVNCEKWITGCHDCPNLRLYPSSFMDRSKENWAKKKELMNGISNLTIITPSDWLAGLVKQSYLKQYPVMTIHNGIDTDLFYPVETDFKISHGIDEKIMLLGVSTSWDEMKGFSDYLKLADILGNEYQIVLVGLTKRQKKELSKRIIGIDRTNSVSELAQVYSAADIFLNLSHCENYPTVNIEAIACGTPVLTYDVGGSKETIYGFGKCFREIGNIIGIKDTIEKWDNNFHKLTREEIIKLDRKYSANQYLSVYNGDHL